MKLFHVYACLLPWIGSSVANVEKTIFLAPEAIHVPQEHPNLDDLHLDVLTPSNYMLRTQIAASFPDPPSSKGLESWYLLDELRQEQRHEVRICWAATVSSFSMLVFTSEAHTSILQQPTDFTLDTYTLTEVFATPELILSLSSYSESRQALLGHSTPSKSIGKHGQTSVLFLRIIAAADYYTTNKTLMQHVPPVDADIILDPFLLNVLPRSLIPTGVYLVILAIVAWPLSNYVWYSLSGVAKSDHSGKEDKKNR